MSKGLRFTLVSVALAIFVAQSAVAAPTPGPANLGFETGNTNGWIIGEKTNAAVTFAHQAESTLYEAKSGKFMLVLAAGCLSETARQTMHLKAGRTISGWAAFDAHDSLPYNDGASVQVQDKLQNVLATPYSTDVVAVGPDGDGEWTEWSYTAPVEADYVLLLQSTNGLDCSFASQGLFDAVGATVTGSPLLPALGLSASVTDDGGAPLAGKTVHFTCGGCTEATGVTNDAGVATIAVTDDPVLFASAVVAGGYCAEFYGDGDANGATSCAGLI